MQLCICRILFLDGRFGVEEIKSDTKLISQKVVFAHICSRSQNKSDSCVIGVVFI